MTDLDHLVFSLHALARMTERDIRVDRGRRVRVVVDSENPLLVITAYVVGDAG